MGGSQIYEPIKALTVDQSLKIVADQDIGRGLPGVVIANGDRMVRACENGIAHMGGEGQLQCLAFAGHVEILRHKWGVIDGDSHLFHRSDQKIGIAIFAQNR